MMRRRERIRRAAVSAICALATAAMLVAGVVPGMQTAMAVQAAEAKDVLAYNGYPVGSYASDEDYPTLRVAVNDGVTATAYQWSNAAAKDGPYSDIGGATSSTYTPTWVGWYRCTVTVNGESITSYPVEIFQPTANNYIIADYRYYIGNGSMAYCKLMDMDAYYYNGEGYSSHGLSHNVFDVIGKFNDKWMCITYNNDGFAFSDDVSSYVCTFDASNSQIVRVEATLSGGKTSARIYGDTCLGTNVTYDDLGKTDLSDEAALGAVLRNGGLSQIQMVGASSIKDAADTDPAFVFKMNDAPSAFYLGYYVAAGTAFHDTTFFSNTVENDKTWEERHSKYEDIATPAYEATTIGSDSVVTTVWNVDSGLAVAWDNLTDGKLSFQFGVGTVADTGANTVPAADTTSDKADDNSYHHHTHVYEWEVYQKATATTDGIMRYRCKVCGTVEYEVPVTAYYVFNKETQESIQQAAPNATVKVETPIFISFHEMVKEALVARPDVTLVVDYKNAGKSYEMTIPAGSGDTLNTLFGDSKFAGFLYLGGAFATVEQ